MGNTLGSCCRSDRQIAMVGVRDVVVGAIGRLANLLPLIVLLGVDSIRETGDTVRPWVITDSCGLRKKTKAAVVEEDGVFEALSITEATSLGLKHFDFAVDAFGHGVVRTQHDSVEDSP